MNYNSKSDAKLAFQIENTGAVAVDGSFTITSIEGGDGNGGTVYVTTKDNSSFTVSGPMTFNYSDPTPHSNHQISLNLNNSSVINLNGLNLNSNYSAGNTINNWIRAYNSSILT